MTQYVKEMELGGDIYKIKDEEVREAIAGTGILFPTLIDTLYPVGSIYLSMNDTAPFSYGVWTKIGTGRALVGVDADSSVAAMKNPGGTFGTANAPLVQHKHQIKISTDEGSALHSHKADGFGTQRFVVADGALNNDESGTLTGIGRKFPYVSASSGFTRVSNTAQEACNHAHNIGVKSDKYTNNQGSGSATNANYQPSIAVYVWQRTS